MFLQKDRDLVSGRLIICIKTKIIMNNFAKNHVKRHLLLLTLDNHLFHLDAIFPIV